MMRRTVSNSFVDLAADSGASGTLRYAVENACDGEIIIFSPDVLDSGVSLASPLSVHWNISIFGNAIRTVSITGPGEPATTERDGG